MAAASRALSLGSTLGPGTKRHWVSLPCDRCTYFKPRPPLSLLEQKEFSIVYEIHLALNHYQTAPGKAA